MFVVRIAFVFLAMVCLQGCDLTQDRAYRTEGPGLDLYSPDGASRTKALKGYFDELCQQADLVDTNAPKVCDADLQDRDWRALVFTGFNDIDARCDAYLNWLDQKRAERLLVDESTIALGALLGGVLAAAAPGTDALNYIALAFGFTQATYSAYHESILLGIEPSTVKGIVNKRRSEFRKAVADRKFEFKPDVVYGLRSYLRICMPQTIITNVNEYSREAISGGDPIDDDTREIERGFSRPLGPDDLFNGREKQGKPEVGEEAKKLFTDDVEGAPDTLVKTVQRGLCVQKFSNGAYDTTATGDASGVDGKVGNQTYAGVFVAEQYLKSFGSDKSRVVVDNRINSIELGILAGGKPSCGGGEIRNYYENVKFERKGRKPTTAEQNFVDLLYAVHNRVRGAKPERTAPIRTDDKSLGNAAVRETLAEVREIAGSELTRDEAAPAEFKKYFEDTLTLDLSEYIDRIAEKG